MTLIPFPHYFAPSGGGGTAYTFDMTAGNYFNFAFGYNPLGPYGSISQEPLPGHNIVEIVTFRPSSNIILVVVFQGDATSILSGLTVKIDGAEVTHPDWYYSSGPNQTRVDVNPYPSLFVEGQTYSFEIS